MEKDEWKKMNGSTQEKQPTLSDAMPNQSEGGKRKEKSKPTEHQEDKEDLNAQRWNNLQGLQLPLFQSELSVTGEFQRVVNETTWIDKLISWAQDTQRQKLFQRLEADSILGGGNLSPYSNELCREIFNALSLPIQTEFVDSASTLFNGCVRNLTANSWFSITANSAQNKNSLQICCPSSIVSVQGFTDCENIENNSRANYGQNPFKKSQNIAPNLVVKIPVFPCRSLHLIWKQWLAAYRWVYNQCVAFLNSGEKLPDNTSLDQYIQNLQSAVNNKWTTCLGKTRQEAVCEAQSAFRQAQKAMRRKPKTERTKLLIKFRSCRSNSQVIQFKNDAFKNGTWFPTKVKGKLFCTAYGYEFPTECVYGTELAYQRTQNGYQWFAIFPEYKEPEISSSQKVIAFDPGVRTFLTGFDGSTILEFGKKDIGRVIRLCLHLDKLIGRKIKASGKENKKLRYKLGQAIKRVRIRIKNLINDMHHKVASLLVQNYRVIFLPTYETSQMVSHCGGRVSKAARCGGGERCSDCRRHKASGEPVRVLKAKRKINRKSVRSMLTWSFGRFAEHLEQSCNRNGVLLVRTNEAYTSKSCPECGQVHDKLGSNKTFKCPHCNFTLPRDWVGAINNLIKPLANLAFQIQGNKLVITCAG
jgi:putative transposase